MSAGWWRDSYRVAPSGRAATGGADCRTPPATLLRLPPAFQEDGARRRRLARVTRPTCLDLRSAGLTIGTARTQRGFVKQWRAKSVELRFVRLPPVRLPHASAGTATAYAAVATHQSGARRIARGLQRFAPLLYTGDMSLQERTAAIRQFTATDDHRVLILSVQAGGQGLNLQCASYVFHFDRWWNPASERQAEGRAHRIGQTQPVHVYTYIMAATIEQQIDRVLKSKMQLFDRFIDGTSLDLSQFLSKHDLYALVGLEPPLGPQLMPESDASETTPRPGLSLEQHVAALLARSGYEIWRIGAGHDGGVDVVAQREDAVGARTRPYIQCKDTTRPTNVDAVRSLNGVLPQGELGVQGVVVCPAGFTPEARTFALARHIQLWDAAKLRELE